MKTIQTVFTPTEARSKLYQLINEVGDTHNPVYIHGKHKSAVLIAAEDWRSIEETLYLLSIPGMRESIIEGINTPVEKCSKKIKW